eukprot:3154984-Alexandrium_andersonii.AAC.1
MRTVDCESILVPEMPGCPLSPSRELRKPLRSRLKENVAPNRCGVPRACWTCDSAMPIVAAKWEARGTHRRRICTAL